MVVAAGDVVVSWKSIQDKTPPFADSLGSGQEKRRAQIEPAIILDLPVHQGVVINGNGLS